MNPDKINELKDILENLLGSCETEADAIACRKVLKKYTAKFQDLITVKEEPHDEAHIWTVDEVLAQMED